MDLRLEGTKGAVPPDVSLSIIGIEPIVAVDPSTPFLGISESDRTIWYPLTHTHTHTFCCPNFDTMFNQLHICIILLLRQLFC